MVNSEPPDIKKWFSSYTYQSPELDTNEKLLFCVGIDDEKKGLYANERDEKCEVLTRINHSHSLSHESNKKVRKHDVEVLCFILHFANLISIMLIIMLRHCVLSADVAQ